MKRSVHKMAVLGRPTAGTLLPQVLSSLSRLLDRDIKCRAIDVEPGKLADVVEKLKREEYAGALISMPHKGTALALGAASGEARALAASNCLKLEGGAVKAHNTEAAGFYDALGETGFRARDGRCQILGSGASARAVAYALGRAGASHVQIWDRKNAQAEAMAKNMAAFWPDTIFSAGAVGSAGLWVQATPMGLPGFPDKPPMKTMAGCVVAIDLVCGPATKFVAMAAAARARACDGRSTLVYQTIRSWEAVFGAVGGPGRAVLKADVMRVRKWR